MYFEVRVQDKRNKLGDTSSLGQRETIADAKADLISYRKDPNWENVTSWAIYQVFPGEELRTHYSAVKGDFWF